MSQLSKTCQRPDVVLLELTFQEIQCLELVFYFLSEMLESHHKAFSGLCHVHLRHLKDWLSCLKPQYIIGKKKGTSFFWPLMCSDNLHWWITGLRAERLQDSMVLMSIDEVNYHYDMKSPWSGKVQYLSCDALDDYQEVFDKHYHAFLCRDALLEKFLTIQNGQYKYI